MFRDFGGLVQIQHHLLCCLERTKEKQKKRNEERKKECHTHLITDQFPFLLVVILPQESGFVWWEVHRILPGEEMKGSD